MAVLYQPHACELPAGGTYTAGTLWRCPDCSRGWYRNYNHALNVYPLWSPVWPWQLLKRRRMARNLEHQEGNR